MKICWKWKIYFFLKKCKQKTNRQTNLTFSAKSEYSFMNSPFISFDFSIYFKYFYLLGISLIYVLRVLKLFKDSDCLNTIFFCFFLILTFRNIFDISREPPLIFQYTVTKLYERSVSHFSKFSYAIPRSSKYGAIELL